MSRLRYVCTGLNLAIETLQLECDLDGGKIEIKHGSQQFKCTLDEIYGGASTQVCIQRVRMQCMRVYLNSLRTHAYGCRLSCTRARAALPS